MLDNIFIFLITRNLIESNESTNRKSIEEIAFILYISVNNRLETVGQHAADSLSD